MNTQNRATEFSNQPVQGYEQIENGAQIMNIKLLIILISLAIFSGPTVAQKDRHGERLISHLDEDGDELISIEEFRAPEQRMLKHADLNEDGAVTLDELQQHMAEQAARRQEEHEARKSEMQRRMAKHFAELDTDGDGSVTAEEAKLAVFGRMDKNGDGFLAADEIKRPERGPRRHRKEHDGPFGG